MEDRISKEQKVVALMIAIYCRKRHGGNLCNDCKEVLLYSLERLKKCRYGQNKPICRRCNTHCYSLNMRIRVKEVMRYSGPRMILYYPYTAIKHILADIFVRKIQ